MEMENNTDESDFSENEIPDLDSLELFEFQPKTNIGDVVNSSSSDVRMKVLVQWCECSAKTVTGRYSSK